MLNQNNACHRNQILAQSGQDPKKRKNKTRQDKFNHLIFKTLIESLIFYVRLMPMTAHPVFFSPQLQHCKYDNRKWMVRWNWFGCRAFSGFSGSGILFHFELYVYKRLTAKRPFKPQYFIRLVRFYKTSMSGESLKDYNLLASQL